MAKILERTFAATALVGITLAAVLWLGTSASQAGQYGDAPWCAVQDEGGDNLTWDCEYDTQQDCLPAVLGGNRGYCSRNPYWLKPNPATDTQR